MNKKIRLTILFICVACFLIVAPILVAYSMGYRIDLDQNKIVATGGIYVRTFPAADQITVDSKVVYKPGVFSNSIFAQSLLPKNHTVLVQKIGHYDYFKTLPVQEKEVTKIENVLLIKNDLLFNPLGLSVDYFSITPNSQNVLSFNYEKSNTSIEYFPINNKIALQSLSMGSPTKVSEVIWSEDSKKALIKTHIQNKIIYYLFDASNANASLKSVSWFNEVSEDILFNPQNSNEIFFIKNGALYKIDLNKISKTPLLPVIKNIVAYKISSNNILWLSAEGTFSSSDTLGNLIEKKSSENFKIDIKKWHDVFLMAGRIFMQEGNSLFVFDSHNKIFENFDTPLSNYQTSISPDNRNLILYNSSEIYLYNFEKQGYQKIFSNQNDKTINSFFWMNNDYVIFDSENKITISEIDLRGNVNAVNISEINIPTNDTSIQLTNFEMFFNRQDGKIYILSENTLFSSEKITP